MLRVCSFMRPANGSKSPCKLRQPEASSSWRCKSRPSDRRVPWMPTHREIRRTSNTTRPSKGRKVELTASLKLKSTSRKCLQSGMVPERKMPQVAVSTPATSQSWKPVAGSIEAWNVWRYLRFSNSLLTPSCAVFRARAALKSWGVKASTRECCRQASRKRRKERFWTLSAFLSSMKSRAVGKSRLRSAPLISWDRDHWKKGHALSW
mmetsp:Transcript_33180/g.91747  ORF Transcript_33180/g.91747 Transcript_33180/m.91747 type:complete len:207 (-) Transcript_33180:664-1284(-)